MNVLVPVMAGLLMSSTALAQTGASFLTGDGTNRAPAAVLHCAGPGGIALPCGTASQPLYVSGQGSLASSSNQTTQIVSEQAIAAATGTPQDSAYTTGAGSMVALLKGVFASLAMGVSTSPAGGTLVSRSAAVAATQSTQLFPANPTRHTLAFQAPASASIWVNFMGGVAAPNGADCVQLGAGTLYESGAFVTRSAVTVYAPVALTISAWEG